MPDFGVNLSRFEHKIQKKFQKYKQNLNDLKLIFLELAHLGLYSGKVWGNQFFLYCMTLVDPYSKLLLRTYASPNDENKQTSHLLKSKISNVSLILHCTSDRPVAKILKRS